MEDSPQAVQQLIRSDVILRYIIKTNELFFFESSVRACLKDLTIKFS